MAPSGWKYRKVYEQIFKNGELVQEDDRSKDVAELRWRLVGRPSKPDYEATRSETELWIKQCFSQKYYLNIEQLEQVQKELCKLRLRRRQHVWKLTSRSLTYVVVLQQPLLTKG